ncbi:MAG: helix-turn-helix domain-containing protein [Acidobacteriota bacterium]|jgi:HTH-type transcriptional regulator/antitoxin HigA|nr:helix-turn-helix domain-containing protein [Acidobacteriota bacterium]MDQ3372413.1 helix-turn-helix domain-containing protein [Acidobacteriota bacterium]
MTLNNKIYGSLLAETLPRKIDTEAENERILKIIEDLMRKGENNISPEEETLLILLCELVEEFEDKAYPIGDVPPSEMLKFILEQRGMKQKELLPVFGSEGIISEILNGKRIITSGHARKLAKFFNVSVELFV